MATAMNWPVMGVRWAVLHGVPRIALRVQARRGDALARLLIGPHRGGDPHHLVEQLRERGTLVRTPLVWATADHDLCREILRDSRFTVSSTDNMGLPAPINWLIRRTDPRLPHPAEPPSMLQVDPPEHTRYRHPVAHAFTPRATERLRDRIIDVTADLINRLESLPQSDLIADYAAPLPAAIIADILGIPDDLRPRMLERGNQGAPLLDIGVSSATFRRGMQALRESGDEIGDHIDRLRTTPDDGIFCHIVSQGDLSQHELASTAALLAGAGFETTRQSHRQRHRPAAPKLRPAGACPKTPRPVAQRRRGNAAPGRTRANDLPHHRLRCRGGRPAPQGPHHGGTAARRRKPRPQLSSQIPPPSTSPGPTPKNTSHSAVASTSAWVPAWPAWKPQSRYAHSSNAFPACNSPAHQNRENSPP